MFASWAIFVTLLRAQLRFPAQGLKPEMPAHQRMRISLGELAGRAADEETRRLVSEFGIYANLRVTRWPRSQWERVLVGHTSVLRQPASS